MNNTFIILNITTFYLSYIIIICIFIYILPFLMKIYLMHYFTIKILIFTFSKLCFCIIQWQYKIRNTINPSNSFFKTQIFWTKCIDFNNIVGWIIIYLYITFNPSSLSFGSPSYTYSNNISGVNWKILNHLII